MINYSSLNNEFTLFKCVIYAFVLKVHRGKEEINTQKQNVKRTLCKYQYGKKSKSLTNLIIKNIIVFYYAFLSNLLFSTVHL